MANEGQEATPIVADTFDDDSAISVPLTDSLASLRSSVMQYQTENGRTYHSMSSGKYVFPNDNSEAERLEVQHYMWLLTLSGELALCPKAQTGVKRALDLGTGTGCWAIEYADAHPESEVIGVDLSPIQPTLVPPNCSFEIDDLEKDWTWSRPFDFIFSRVMASCFEDYQAYINKAYNALEPGGWLEMQDIVLPYGSDDGTLEPGSPIARLGTLFQDASATLGRPIDVAVTYRAIMEKAGFKNIVEKHYKWPLNTWPRDKRFKEIGSWAFQNYDQGLEGLTLGLFTRALGWTKEEVMVFCAEVRRQLRDRNVHAYLPIMVVYGQRPENVSSQVTTSIEATEVASPGL